MKLKFQTNSVSVIFSGKKKSPSKFIVTDQETKHTEEDGEENPLSPKSTR